MGAPSTAPPASGTANWCRVCKYLTLVTFAFLLSFSVGSLFLLPSDSEAAATPVSCTESTTMVTCLSMTTSPSTIVSMELTPQVSQSNPQGTAFTTAQSIVNVKSNTGKYNLDLTTNSTNDSSRSLTNQSSTLSPKPTISPTAGTLTAPAPLSPNSWGFTLDSLLPPPTPPSPSSIPTPESPIWSSMPISGEQNRLVTKGDTDIVNGANTIVHYGATVDHQKPQGTYTTTILYTATVEPFGPPTITTVTPTTGPTTGGTTITILGTNFYDLTPTTGVQIGTGAEGWVPCNPFTVNSPTQITCTTPSETAGAKDILITTANGNVTGTPSSGTGFTYEISIPDLGPMQALTADQCPAFPNIGKAYDARNNQYYFVQRIPNSGGEGIDLCWMETNLRYAGDGDWNSSLGWPDDRYATTTAGGTTTANPNDNTRNLQMTTSGYFGGSVTNANAVAGVADPGGNATLDVANPQATANTTFYGYLYNWCAAMGGQPTACNNTTSTPQTNFDPSTSICPSGWRLPTGQGGNATTAINEFGTLANSPISATNNSQGSTNLRNNWLAVYSGNYSNGLYAQGSYGYYWSSSVYNGTNAYLLNLDSSSVNPGTNYYGKNNGFAVRCVLP